VSNGSSAAERLHFVVPGPLEQRTGGYLYDARMVAGLRARGWNVHVHNLAGRFPDADDDARRAMTETLTGLPDGALVMVDGLALGGLPEVVASHRDRLTILGLVHHPLADETGLDEGARTRFTRSEGEALASCSGVLVTSGYTAHRLRDFGVDASRVRAVLPGTEPAAPAGGPGPGQPPALLCVATVTRRKGHDVLLGALARIRDLPWSCVCAGGMDRDEAWTEEIRARLREFDLEDRVSFVGEHDAASLERLYAAASLFVLASHYEGYGMALAEALARGLPVVSTTGGAIPFTVPEDAGILVDPGDPEAFATALRAALDPARRSELATAALAAGRALPDWEASVTAFAQAVLSLSAGRQGGSPVTDS
jgi:glycosyltransferase involved in cell wall biosynthesis